MSIDKSDPSRCGTWEFDPAIGVVLTAKQADDARWLIALAVRSGDPLAIASADRIAHLFPPIGSGEGESKAGRPYNTNCLYCEMLQDPCSVHREWVPSPLPISSPTVPALTGAGPWQRIEDVPESVARVHDREGDVWRRCSSGWEHGALHDPNEFSPFVAAEEKL